MAERQAALDKIEFARLSMGRLPQIDVVSGFDDPAYIAEVREFLEDRVSDDFVAVSMVAGVGQEWKGLDGLIDFWRDWLEPWEAYSIQLERIVEGANGVLVEVLQRGRLAGAEHDVETPSAAVYFFREDQLARIEFYLEQAPARESAGVPV
jgi:ketosteroid isomerase-like protein